MINTNSRRLSSRLFKFLVPALVLLIPMLALGGSVSTTAQASAPISGVLGAKPSDTAKTLVLRVYFRSTTERDQLANELDAGEVSTQNGYLVIYADRPTYSRLIARGLRVEIDEVQTKYINNPNLTFGGNPTTRPTSPDTFYGGYRTVEENYAYMDQLVAAYPNLAEKVDIGDSWCKTHPGACTTPAPTWNGYDLFVLHITNRSIPGPKPVYWFETGIHSREIGTPEVATRFMSQLLDGYATNADSHWLVDWHDIWIMPHVNPDGHHMVEANPNSPYLQRKNSDRDDGCTTWPPSGGQLGTDNNRNFPFKWGCCGGSSGSSCSETYRGPSSGSEEETQAVVNKIRSLIADQRGPLDTDPAPVDATGFYQSMHSNASLNLYPWGWTTTDAPNGPDLANIGKHLQAVNASPSGNGYQAGQPPEILYAVDGDTADWGYGELGIPSYTTEIAGSSFFPPYPCIDNGPPTCTDGDPTILNGIYPSNKGALLYSAKIARTPYLLTHGPDTGTVTTTPMTVTQGTPSALTANINYAWTGNSFSQNIAAAEYYVDTPPWASGTAIAMQPADGNFNSPTEGALATVDTTALAPGRHILFVRGRGANNYAGFETWGPMSAVFLDVLPNGGPTNTPGPATSTSTPVPATNTPTRTNTVAPPTNTATRTNTPQPTNTGIVPTSTSTTIPPTATRTSTTVAATATRTPTGGPGATNTLVPTATSTSSGPTATTGAATATSTACTLTFADVLPDNTFYPFIRCLACRGIINGYPCGGTGEPCNPNNDPYFRPGNNLSRGQLAKIVANSAGLNGTVSGQTFEDVLPGTAFYTYTERLYAIGAVGGYQCGIDPGEPCGPGNKPYYRPGANITRGQLTKVVSNAAGFNDPAPTTFTFTDVPVGSTFHVYVERLLLNRPGVMSGYPCGGPGEPCDNQNRPYFRPGNNLTRGQASKIVANTFFPNCQTPAR